MTTSGLAPPRSTVAPTPAVWTARTPPVPVEGRAPRRADRAWPGPVGVLVGVGTWVAHAGGWAAAWLLAVVVAASLVPGWHPVVITSGSMEPLIGAGDVVVVAPSAELGVGDVVTVRRGGGLVTHRVVAVEGAAYRTQGDANAVADSELAAATDVVGRGRLVVPFVGFVVQALARPLGATSAAALLATTSADGSDFAVGTVDASTNLAASFSCGLLGIGAGIRVTWTAPTSPLVTSLEVERRANGGAWSTVATLAPSAAQYDDVPVSLSTTYDYRVVSSTGTAWTETSAVVGLTTPLLCL